MSGCSFCREYNGWRNRPTWLVNLWWTNDYVSQQWLDTIAREALDQASGNEKEAASGLVETLKEHFEICYFPTGASLLSDLIITLADFVDFAEIAEAAIDGVWEGWQEENEEEE